MNASNQSSRSQGFLPKLYGVDGIHNEPAPGYSLSYRSSGGAGFYRFPCSGAAEAERCQAAHAIRSASTNRRGVFMIHFSCDSCQIMKAPNEIWILGLAAEAVGVTAARREVNILSTWDSANAVHPLAVHFCSEACKLDYIDKLFGKDEKVVSEIRSLRSKPKARKKTKKVRSQVA